MNEKKRKKLLFLVGNDCELYEADTFQDAAERYAEAHPGFQGDLSIVLVKKVDCAIVNVSLVTKVETRLAR